MNSQLKQMRKDYKAEHGHFPDDYKARMNCVVCQVKSLTEHAIIANAAKGDALVFIDQTDYSDQVKQMAKRKLEYL